MTVFLDNTVLTTRNHGFLAIQRTLIDVFNPEIVAAGMGFNSCKLQCSQKMKRFTDEVGVDNLKNDFDSFFVPMPSSGEYTSSLINTDTGEVYSLEDDTYGEYFDITSPKKVYGYRLDWFKVWSVLGHGCYKVEIEIRLDMTKTSPIISEFKSVCFELKKYTDAAADGTVRIETLQLGILKHGNSYKDLKLANGKIVKWRQQWRFFGSLSISGLPRENDRILLTSRTHVQIKDEIVPEYDLIIKRIRVDQIEQFMFDGIFGNTLKVVDYNVLNYDGFKEEVLVNDSIELRDGPTVNRKRKSFTFKMSRDKRDMFKTNN